VAASISTHVLDTERGRPAEGVRVELRRDGAVVAGGETDGDGRIGRLADGLDAGEYVLAFRPPSPFFREVALTVSLDDGHYHVPLLVSSYGCASYRGS
jgi:5-hydroxyisourate hydrolase-like protein (transthyretin family)